MADGICQPDCNVLACLWDGNDCDGIESKEDKEDQRDAFSRTLDFVMILFEKTLKAGSQRNWFPHMPFMFDIELIEGTIN